MFSFKDSQSYATMHPKMSYIRTPTTPLPLVLKCNLINSHHVEGCTPKISINACHLIQILWDNTQTQYPTIFLSLHYSPLINSHHFHLVNRLILVRTKTFGCSVQMHSNKHCNLHCIDDFTSKTSPSANRWLSSFSEEIVVSP